ncbi:MAG: ABC transporter permease subunit [Halobacteriaceae archaeon]
MSSGSSALGLRRALIVAKKDYRDAVRSWELWSLMALFILFTAGFYFALNKSDLLTLFWPSFLTFIGGSNFGLTTVEFIGFYVGLAEAVLPVVVLTVTHKAIAGEVESGSVKFLFSAPLTRFDAIVGKILGRAGVLWTGVALGFVVSAGVIVYLGGQFSPVPYLLFLLFTCLFVLAYVSVGVALSAIAQTSSRAVLYVISFFIGVGLLLDYVPNLIHKVTDGVFFPKRIPMPGSFMQGPPDAPAWFFFIPRLSPGRAYNHAVIGLVSNQPFGYEPAVAPEGGPLPFYLTGWFALATLVLWIVVPALVGYWHFNRTDIN